MNSLSTVWQLGKEGKGEGGKVEGRERGREGQPPSPAKILATALRVSNAVGLWQR